MNRNDLDRHITGNYGEDDPALQEDEPYYGTAEPDNWANTVPIHHPEAPPTFARSPDNFVLVACLVAVVFVVALLLAERYGYTQVPSGVKVPSVRAPSTTP